MTATRGFRMIPKIPMTGIGSIKRPSFTAQGAVGSPKDKKATGMKKGTGAIGSGSADLSDQLMREDEQRKKENAFRILSNGLRRMSGSM